MVTYRRCLTTFVVVAAATFFPEADVGAQTAVTLRIAGPSTAPTLTGDGFDATKPITFDAAKGALITTRCDGVAVKCKDVTARLAGATATLGRSTPVDTMVTFTLPPTEKDASVELFVGSTKASPAVLLFRATKSAATTTGNESSRTEPTVYDLATVRCPTVTLQTGADFVLDGRGNLIRGPQRTLNEGDQVHVAIYADRRLLDRIRVARVSPTRPLVVSNILGAGTVLDKIDRQAEESTSCEVLDYTVTDFGPGAGKIEVTALGSDKPTSMYNYEFKVNALYTGVLALSVARTTLRDYTFGKTFNGTDTVVTRSPAAGGRVLYVVTYTPFMWGQRDVTVPPRRAIEYLNPFIGFALNDVANNAFAGVDLELPGRVFLSYGIHAGKVTVIQDASGAVVGQKFANRAASVPTEKRWSFKPFVSVGVDLLAASNLLKSAVTK